MGHQAVGESIYSTAIKDENTHTSSWVDVSKCDKVALLISVAKTSTPGNLTLSLEGSCDGGTTAVTLDFQDGGGLGTSEAYSATAEDFIWLSPGAIVPLIRASLVSAATTDATKYWTPAIWLIAYKS